MRSIGMAITLFCVFSFLSANGEDETSAAKSLSMSGALSIDMGEFLKARSSGGGNMGSNPQPDSTVAHIWYGHTVATLNLLSRPLESFSIRASFEFRQYMNMFPITQMKDNVFGQYYWNGFYIREGQGIFSPLAGGQLRLDIALGYMPYKYNADARDLGEYLFRTGTYPLFIRGEFDRPFARLTGLRVGLTYDGDPISAKADLLGLIEREMLPFNDVSLAAVAGVNILKMLDIGGGVDLAHLIPVDSRLTTPKTDASGKLLVENMYFTYNSDSTVADTGFYTFKGTKLMVRGSVDPVGIWRGKNGTIDNICGRSGGRVYAEYAIIGLENYPSSGNANNPRGYASMAERSPWMVGINLPAWKIFDVCALEFERFPSYFPDDYWRVVVNGWPLPSPPPKYAGIVDSSYGPRWNWSLYMKKQIVRHFSLICQMGRGHQRWEMNQNAGALFDFETAMVKPDQWGWICSGEFDF